MSIIANNQINELIKLSNSFKRNPVYWSLTAVIITPKENVTVTTCSSLRVEGDFIVNFADYVFITVKLDVETFFSRISEYEDELQVQLTFKEVTEKGIPIKGGYQESKLYDASLLINTDRSLTSKLQNQTDASENQLLNQVEIPIQLIDPNITKVRVEKAGGVKPNVTMEELIRFSLSEELEDNTNTSSLKVNAYTGVRGVHLVPPDNIKRYSQIIIPEKTKVIHLPKYLQEKEYGVYATGLGRFYLNGWWYVYPLYNFTRFKKEEKTATVVLVPKDMSYGVENSYFVKGGHITILSNGDTQIIDVSTKQHNSVGNGFVSYNASDLINNTVTVKDGKVESNSGNNRKVVGVKETKSRFNNLATNDTFSDNMFHTASLQSAAMGKQIIITWLNALPNALIPGMPIKVVYMKDNLLQEAYGTLINRSFVTAQQSGNMLDSLYTTTCTMAIHIEK